MCHMHFVCAALHVTGLGCGFNSILRRDCHLAVCGRRPTHRPQRPVTNSCTHRPQRPVTDGWPSIVWSAGSCKPLPYRTQVGLPVGYVSSPDRLNHRPCRPGSSWKHGPRHTSCVGGPVLHGLSQIVFASGLHCCMISMLSQFVWLHMWRKSRETTLSEADARPIRGIKLA